MTPESRVQKKIVLWGGWYGSHNIGDQVLLLSITDLLEKHLAAQLSFTVLTDNAVWVREYTSRGSSSRINPIQSRRELFNVIRAIYECDMFVFGGGVPFYDQTYHVMVMGYLIALLRLFHKPHLLWSVSSQAVRSRFARTVFRWVLGKASAITYRDEHTRALFASCGVNLDQMEMAPDPGFSLEWAAVEEGVEILKRTGWVDNSRPLFGLTPRTLRSADGEAGTHYEAKTPAQYRQEIDCFAAALDWLWEQGYQPVFIPMNTVYPDDDRVASREIIRQARHGGVALMVEESFRPRVAPTLYNLCVGSFVARVHGGITSMLGNCPMMMYAFAPKHVGIMEMMQMKVYCLNEEGASPSKVIEVLASMLGSRQELRERLSARLIELKRAATMPAKQAAEILGSELRGS